MDRVLVGIGIMCFFIIPMFTNSIVIGLICLLVLTGLGFLSIPLAVKWHIYKEVKKFRREIDDYEREHSNH